MLRRSREAFNEAQRYMPGGVSSAARAFGPVGGDPPVIASGKAARIRDVDVATETAVLARNQVLSQAGVSVLGQANQLPQLALSLLG